MVCLYAASTVPRWGGNERGRHSVRFLAGGASHQPPATQGGAGRGLQPYLGLRSLHVAIVRDKSCRAAAL
jgi:hypothetical protein